MPTTVYTPGICRVCGCTELSPCILSAADSAFGEDEPGILSRCSWLDPARTLCSNLHCIAQVPLDQPGMKVELTIEEANVVIRALTSLAAIRPEYNERLFSLSEKFMDDADLTMRMPDWWRPKVLKRAWWKRGPAD